jgi:cytochrome c oxidase subunit 3
MTITLLFLAVLMGAIIWWLFRQSINVQPWVAQSSGRDVHDGVLARPAAKTALWVFLAVVTSLFALFISAYAMRMHFGDWAPLPKPKLLWWNTALLIATSISMQSAVFAARRGNADGLRSALIGAGVLSVAFLAGQLAVWQQLNDAGYFVPTPSSSCSPRCTACICSAGWWHGAEPWRSCGAASRSTSCASPSSFAPPTGTSCSRSGSSCSPCCCPLEGRR